MENKAPRPDRKWRSALWRAALVQGGPPVPVARLTAPLAWGANLWLLLIVWPALSDHASSPRLASGALALAAATPLLAGAALASVGLPMLASGCFLVAFPLGLAGVFAAGERGGSELPVAALAVIAASMWVYVAAASRALRLPMMAEGSGLRIDPLQGRGRSPRLFAARQRSGRIRDAAVALTVAGAAAIALIAPSGGDPGELQRAFGDEPRHAAVLIAMVGVAIGVGVVSVFTTALLRPPTPDDVRPPSPMRAALGLVIALAGAVTYYVLRG